MNSVTEVSSFNIPVLEEKMPNHLVNLVIERLRVLSGGTADLKLESLQIDHFEHDLMLPVSDTFVGNGTRDHGRIMQGFKIAMASLEKRYFVAVAEDRNEIRLRAEEMDSYEMTLLKVKLNATNLELPTGISMIWGRVCEKNLNELRADPAESTKVLQIRKEVCSPEQQKQIKRSFLDLMDLCHLGCGIADDFSLLDILWSDRLDRKEFFGKHPPFFDHDYVDGFIVKVQYGGQCYEVHAFEEDPSRIFCLALKDLKPLPRVIREQLRNKGAMILAVQEVSWRPLPEASMQYGYQIRYHAYGVNRACLIDLDGQIQHDGENFAN